MLLFDRPEPNTPFKGSRKPRLIAIMGKAGAGKDTVRSILEKEHRYKGYAFADPMREMIECLFDVSGLPAQYRTERELKEQPIPGLGVSYRQMMQKLGTEWGRGLSESIWVDITASRVSTDLFQYHCISDLRFENEAAWVRSVGGVLWRVERPGIAAVNAHVSELEADGIQADAVLQNTGSILDLGDTVRRTLKNF